MNPKAERARARIVTELEFLLKSAKSLEKDSMLTSVAALLRTIQQDISESVAALLEVIEELEGRNA